MKKKGLIFSLIFVLTTPLFASPVYAAETEVPSEEAQTYPWFIEDIGAPDMWADLDARSDNKEIIVAVIDTGVDYTHPDLASALWTNSAELNGLPGVDDDGNGYVDDIYGINTYSSDKSNNEVMDDSRGSIQGHGTHIAGTIAQVCNITADSNPYNIKIMALKAGSPTGAFPQTSVMEAVEYAVANGADVINLSLGTENPRPGLKSCMEKAAQSAIIVSAAGNSGVAANENTVGKTSYYPAAYHFVIGVMAHDSNQNLAYFSNYDLLPGTETEYEISAPGIDINSTIPGNQHRLLTGTSMASAVVAGGAALLCQYFPDLGAESLRALILQNRVYNITKNDGGSEPLTFGSMNLSVYTTASDHTGSDDTDSDITDSDNNDSDNNDSDHTDSTITDSDITDSANNGSDHTDSTITDSDTTASDINGSDNNAGSIIDTGNTGSSDGITVGGTVSPDSSSIVGSGSTGDTDSVTRVTETTDPGSATTGTTTVYKTPKIKSIKTKNKTFILRWSKQSAAKKYVIYRKKGASGTYKKYAVLSGSATKFTDKKLKKNVYYYYKIRYITADNRYSSFSKPVKVRLK